MESGGWLYARGLAPQSVLLCSASIFGWSKEISLRSGNKTSRRHDKMSCTRSWLGYLLAALVIIFLMFSIEPLSLQSYVVYCIGGVVGRGVCPGGGSPSWPLLPNAEGGGQRPLSMA